MKRLSRRLAALGLLLALVVTLAHAELTPVEGRIVQAVKARSPAALALLERSVNINSGTLNVLSADALSGAAPAESVTPSSTVRSVSWRQENGTRAV